MIESNLKLIFLGTGTSQGVPVIGSKHPVCLSTNPKDKRLRSSILVQYKNKNILVDCGPDFRQQMLRENIDNIEAILLTHEHNDHIIGLDDMRPINFLQKKAIPIYGLNRVTGAVKTRFPYVFSENKYPGVPEFTIKGIEKNLFEVINLPITPLPILHGKLPILGYRIGNIAYLTDVSHVPQSTIDLLKGIEIAIIGALRQSPKHHSHLTLNEAIELAYKINAKKTFFTHISHYMGFYNEVETQLPKNMHLAYDQLSLSLKY